MKVVPDAIAKIATNILEEIYQHLHKDDVRRYVLNNGINWLDCPRIKLFRTRAIAKILLLNNLNPENYIQYNGTFQRNALKFEGNRSGQFLEKIISDLQEPMSIKAKHYEVHSAIALLQSKNNDHKHSDHCECEKWRKIVRNAQELPKSQPEQKSEMKNANEPVLQSKVKVVQISSSQELLQTQNNTLQFQSYNSWSSKSNYSAPNLSYSITNSINRTTLEKPLDIVSNPQSGTSFISNHSLFNKTN